MACRRIATLVISLIPALAILCLVSLRVVLADEISPAQRRSGSADLSRETRAMQDDDTANPGMLSVLDGETAWSKRDGAAAKSCAECHGDGAASMKGVAARYPAFDAARSGPIDLEDRINLCRTERQQAAPLARESQALLSLTAFVAKLSRGLPVAPPDDPRLAPFRAAGRALFTQRQGQINLSCANCHDDNWGKRLAGAVLPQGHPNGYPLYRLEWQAMGSLQRRLRNCLVGMRAEPYSYGSAEYLNLELYLMERAKGLAMESPAVRP